MLVDLGQPVYVDDFEKHFLAAAADFYAKEAQEYISSSDCPEYLRKAEKRLMEELERVKNYLDESTEIKITRVVENELIKEQVRGSSSRRDVAVPGRYMDVSLKDSKELSREDIS